MKSPWSPKELLAATAPWSPAQQAAWGAPVAPSPSDWCDQYRELAGDGVLEEGRWKTSRTPYLREILDAIAPDSGYTEVIFKKSARVGGTEVINCAISYLVDVDPDPILLVYPDKEKALEEVHDRIEPMLRAQERTAPYFTGRAWDVKQRRIKLSRCVIRVGWSRSALTLGGFQARYRFHDEIDKDGEPIGEADARKLGDARGMQYGDRGKSYKTSTPTTRHGPIHQLWESCPDRRRFHVPCPHCGELQVLEWERLRWAESDRWDELDREELLALEARASTGDLDVSYACTACNEPIRDRHKEAFLNAGQWVSEGFPPGERPRSSRVAYHISALYSPWVRFWEVLAQAAKLRAEGKWQHFVNSWLGEIYEEKASELTPEIYLARRVLEGIEGRAPEWTRAIVAGVDVQQDHLWAVVRACGTTAAGTARRRNLAFGKITSWAELRALLARKFPIEGHPRLPEVGIHVLAIDVGGGGKTRGGTRTDETFVFAASDSRVWLVRGRGGEFVPEQVEPFQVAQSGKGKLRGQATRMLNVQYYKTKLAGIVRQEPDVVWEEAAGITPVYARQMSAEHQVWRHRPNGLSYLWWQPRRASAANHLWDASVYLEAAADMARVELLPTVVELGRIEQQRRQRAREAEEEVPWVDGSSWRQGASGDGAW